MLSPRIPVIRNQALIGVSLFAIGLWLAWEIGGMIVAGDTSSLAYGALLLAACAVAVACLRKWRWGFYLFLIWLMFEDLIRKYMGNNLVLFFGKDVIAGLVCVSLYIAIRHGREKTFRPPFLLFLAFFVWLGVLQVFNQNSPSIWYGLLGVKDYFYYIPLMFVGYALIRNDEDLQKFLLANMELAGAIGVLGIIQAIVGNSFLNPAHLAPELEELGNLSRATPSGQTFTLPDSVFVSSGRYSEYLILAFILAMGTAGYLLLHTSHHRKLVFLVLGLLGVAAFLSGNRGCFMDVFAMVLLLPIGFLWGAPWRQGSVHRVSKAIRRSAIVAALGLILMFLIFPSEAGSRLEFYTETLLPSGSAYQLSERAWDYPVQNFLAVFAQPNWVIGNGIGTASLGVQYVAKLTGQRPPSLGVEEGYGMLIIELGIIAPLLWILWTAALLWYSWKVVRRLRETRLFPIALAIFGYAFLLLYPWMYASSAPYQNYICNAFLWLLVGVLFRLPDLLVNPQAPIAVRGDRANRSIFPS
jgi:hypothetical protein